MEVSYSRKGKQTPMIILPIWTSFEILYVPISCILSILAAILDAILDLKNWKHNLINGS